MVALVKSFKLEDRASTLLILLVVALFFSFTQLFSRLDNQAFDLGQRWHPQAKTNQIVIIGIDEASLKHIGRWPWSRQVHADLLNKLASQKTSAIGFDVIFSEPETPQADHALADAIKLAGNVVLPELLEVSHQSALVTQTLPLAVLADNAAAVGRVHVPLDDDGIARGVYLFEGINQQLWPLFAAQILRVAHLSTQSPTQPPTPFFAQASTIDTPAITTKTLSTDNGLMRKGFKKVNFIGPPNTVPAISYAKVLAGVYPQHYFKDKIVLIGATASGLGDFLPTPVSAMQQPMSGVEYHANVMTAIMRDALVDTPPKWMIILLCGLFAVLPMLWIPSMSPFGALMSNLVYFIIIVSIGVFSAPLLHVWLPVSSALVSIVLAYPVWSWRKLEAAQRYLDTQLLSLRTSLLNAGLYQEQHHEEHAPKGLADRFERRINQVSFFSEKLQAFRNDRYETLAFISHDIRAPLAASKMILKDETDNPKYQRVINMLDRALKLSESYLRASRAEMLTTQQFAHIDIVAVCHQAFDDAYEIAQEKQIKLTRHLPDEVVWLNGDFGLLHRAVLNLMLNAIQYSANNTEITLNFVLERPYVCIEIKDQGMGIATQQLQRLFKRYSRLLMDAQSTEGSGLGLYFVKTVAQKHAGSVRVTSELGVGSVFIVRLPVVEQPLHNTI